MHSTLLRPALRAFPKPAPALRLPQSVARRGFASEAPGSSGKAEPSHPPPIPRSGSKTFIFAAGGVVIALVAGRYILASSKSPRDGQAARLEARRDGDFGNRDPRDSGVKTLEDKKKKEQNS